MLSNNSNSLVLEPEQMNAAFAKAYNTGDLATLLDLYEPNGIHLNSNGVIEQGIEQIRPSLKALLELKGKMISTNIYCLRFENMALLRAHFHLEATASDGSPFTLEGHTAEIVREQPDGSWKYIVDHPFGANPLQKLTSITK